MQFLAALISYVLFILALPFLLGHPKLRAGFWTRLGFYGRRFPRPPGVSRLWVHGASAGDILALLPTVRALRRLRPQLEVVISTITNSGRAMAEGHDDLFSHVFYCPYDLPGAVRRAMHRLQPDGLVLEYTELWPQLIHAARRAGVPVILHNGRLAAARQRQYRLLFCLTGNLLRQLQLLLMRDEDEAQRALALGARREQVQVTGNTKYDSLTTRPLPAVVACLRQALGADALACLWVAGSTHEGEEEPLLDTFRRLRVLHPQLRLLLAPRYSDRAERLVGLAQRAHLTARRRSQPGGTVDVLVLDTMGELNACYALATLVFVGGSFVPRGGQNILEPAACARPVLFGPYMHNFTESVRVLLGRGGIQVANHAQLERVMHDLLSNPEQRRELGDLAARQVTAIGGAAERNALCIERLMPPLQPAA